ncbi:MAG TPA: 6,7-dimethyl-8-ribityllumazine synthase [Armatimonadetes bacterium]|nr:6,7-dimethyl-8-ribityllumazine synthase [Armatimonadota bacterium]
MANEIHGQLNAEGLKFGVLVSRFNEFITSKLKDGAIDALVRHGASEHDITVVWVPGSFELPLAAQKMAQSKKYDAVIAVGAVIRGATPHFDFVAGEAAKGLARVGLDTGIPVIFGVVTTENLENAIERAGVRVANRGFEAAMTAIETVNVMKQL